ncbi:MAG: hypothetical protein ACREK2_01180 [Gemmatimonadota bacterium]
MDVVVDPGRFLSLSCDAEELMVYDRKEGMYHLLRASAARVWKTIGEGGSFEIEPAGPGEEDPIALLQDAGLVTLEASIPRKPSLSRRTWLDRAMDAATLPLIVSISTHELALGHTDGPSLVEPEDPEAYDFPCDPEGGEER